MEKVIKGGSLENAVDEIAKEVIKRDNAVSEESMVAVGSLQEEVSSVKSAIGYVVEEEISPNIYNPETDTNGVQLANAGYTFENAEYSTSDFIDISGVQNPQMAADVNQGNQTIRICYYDAQKANITNTTQGKSVGIGGDVANNTLFALDVPQGAAYIRFHYATAHVSRIYVGVELSPYEYVPYGTEVIVLPSNETKSARGNYHTLGDRLDAITPKDTTNTIVYWGDSLTEGNQAADGGSIPGYMRNLLSDWTVYNFGRGGDMSNSIACRQGGMNYVVKAGQTIPASGSVTLQITDNIGSENVGVRLFEGLPAWASLNPCSIAGVRGNLARVSSSYPNNEAIFTRLEAGEAVSIDRPTTVISNGEIFKGFIIILSGGTNGGFDTSNPSELVNIYRWMIDHANVEKYIVMGQYHGTNSSWQLNCNKLLQAEFGRHFLDAETYMKTPIYNGDAIVSSYVLADEGLTPTADDLTAIANNQYPPQIMYDGVHFNKWGYDCIAKLQYKRGKELGYWT